MSLSAHTNAVGYHEAYDVQTARQRGVISGRNSLEEIIDSGSYRSGVSDKPAPFHAINGDRGRAYNYNRHIRRVLSNAPYTMRRLDLSPSIWEPGLPTHDYTWDLYVPSVYKTLSFTPSLDPDGDALDESITEALNGLGGATASLGASLGESKQTTKMFAQKASRFLSGYHALRRKDYGTALALFTTGKTGGAGRSINASDVGGAWLEMQYGWKPLLQDLHDVYHVINKTTEVGTVVRGVGYGKRSAKGSFRQGSIIMDWEAKSSARTVLLSKVTNSRAYLLQSLGLINPASIAWELVPYSFVIDWFMPIGATLEAMTATVGLEDLGGWTSTQFKWIVKGRAETGTYRDQSVWINSPGDYQEAGFDFHRYAYTRHPRPAFYAKENPFTSTHVENALALLTQLRR